MFDVMVRIVNGYSITLKFKNDSLTTNYNLGKIITAKYDRKTYPSIYKNGCLFQFGIKSVKFKFRLNIITKVPTISKDYINKAYYYKLSCDRNSYIIY